MSMIDYLADRSSVGCHLEEIQNIRIDNTPKEAVLVKKKEKYISYKDCRRMY